MRRALGLFSALVLLVGLAGCLQHWRMSGDAPVPPQPEGSLRVATHNVHYIDLRAETGSWSRGDWAERRDALDAAFRALDADLVAFQEMESFGGGSVSRENLALDWLLARNPGYAAAAVGDPAAFPSTQPILHRRDRLAPLDQGWFFFSETPDVVYSRTFDGSYPAFASWARFRDRRSGAAFRVVNVHFDHASAENRRRSAELVAERIVPWIAAGETVLLAGDTNAREGAAPMARLEAAGLEFLPVEGATYHFDLGLNLFGAIDHIAVGPGAAPLGPTFVLRRRFEAEWPSDHYPVLADLRLDPG